MSALRALVAQSSGGEEAGLADQEWEGGGMEGSTAMSVVGADAAAGTPSCDDRFAGRTSSEGGVVGRSSREAGNGALPSVAGEAFGGREGKEVREEEKRSGVEGSMDHSRGEPAAEEDALKPSPGDLMSGADVTSVDPASRGTSRRAAESATEAGRDADVMVKSQSLGGDIGPVATGRGMEKEGVDGITSGGGGMGAFTLTGQVLPGAGSADIHRVFLAAVDAALTSALAEVRQGERGGEREKEGEREGGGVRGIEAGGGQEVSVSVHPRTKDSQFFWLEQEHA